MEENKKTFEKNLNALDDAIAKIEGIKAELLANPETDTSVICVVSNETTGKTGVTVYGSTFEIATSLAGTYRDDAESGKATLKLAQMLLAMRD